MILQNRYSDFSTAYSGTLADVLEYGEVVPAVDNPLSPARHYGRKPSSKTVELRNYSFIIDDPYSSLFFSDKRTISLPYAVGLLIWSMRGSDRADWLAYYHPNVKSIFPDVGHLSGAFGKRMFRYKGRFNQVEAVINKLRNHPTTRRATVSIAEPNDHQGNNIEFPCALATQYFIRDNKLHSITYMRAQSAVSVMPYDVFLFMNIQIFVAARLGLDVGSYTHNCGTLHLYEDETDKAKEILSSDIEPVSLYELHSKNNVVEDYEKLFGLERSIRSGKPSSNDFQKDTYFNDLAEMLIHYSNLRGDTTASFRFQRFYHFRREEPSKYAS